MGPEGRRFELTKHWQNEALHVGGWRLLRAREKGRPEAYGNNGEDSWTCGIEGAGGELAALLYYALPLDDFYYEDLERDGIKIPDCSPRIQIRTRSKQSYELLLHPKDRDDHVFILVTGIMPVYDIRGWNWGYEVKKSQWWKDPAGNRPAYFPPHSALHSYLDFPQELIEEARQYAIEQKQKKGIAA